MKDNDIPTKNIEKTEEWRAGRRAFHDGVRCDECPYPVRVTDGRRTAWLSGWYSARTDKKLGHILRRWEDELHPPGAPVTTNRIT